MPILVNNGKFVRIPGRGFTTAKRPVSPEPEPTVIAGWYDEDNNLVLAIPENDIPEARPFMDDENPYGISEIMSENENFKRIILPKDVTHVGNRVFCGCIPLMSVVLQEGTTSIGEGAFIECVELARIDLPVSLISIGEGAFIQCESLTDIYYAGTRDTWTNNIEKGEAWNEDTGEYTIHCTDGDLTKH